MFQRPSEVPQFTIWGPVQNVDLVAPGIAWVDTASHGGVVLAEERWKQLPVIALETRYSQFGQYEEDADWAIPRLFFDVEFSAFERSKGKDPARYRNAAVRTLTGYLPHILAALQVEPASS